MKDELIRCSRCGLPHPSSMRSCLVTGERLPFGPVEGGALSSTPRLLLLSGEGEQVLHLDPVNTVGRHPNNSIQLLDKILSKQHCVLELRGDRFVLRDLGSLNGTFLNGERLRGEVTLEEGDEIALGATRCRFQMAGDSRGASGDHTTDVAPERLLAHLATDKPIYRPGESLYARAAVLDAFTRAPAGAVIGVLFEVCSPRGDVVATRPGQVAQGVAALSWTIPSDLPGGAYKVVASFPEGGFPRAEIGFSVRAYRVPRLKTELEFARKAYGPGDEVVAALSAARAEGGVPAGATARVIATVDGVEVHRVEVALDAAGRCTARFRLPLEIAAGEGTLAMIVRDGGVEETAAKALPIVVHRILLSLYPEGGDLVVGLPSRLYIEARTPRGKPADVAGRIFDGTGEVLAHFRTEHEGRARVALTPTKSGRAYMVALDEPASVSEIFPLPEVAREGFSIMALDDATAAEDAVRFRIGASLPGKARIALYAREREVAALGLTLAAGEVKEVALTPPTAADAVLRATVYDAAGLPRAERLVFRRPLRSVRVEVEAIPARAGLRSPASVAVRTTDGTGKPVAATVMLTVVDDAVLELVERRDRSPRLPVQALLGNEVRELADAHLYLEETASGGRAMDLLLGTQGWRRFAFYDAARFIADYGDQAERALARRRPIAPLNSRKAVMPAPAMAPVRRIAPRAPVNAAPVFPDADESPPDSRNWKTAPRAPAPMWATPPPILARMLAAPSPPPARTQAETALASMQSDLLQSPLNEVVLAPVPMAGPALPASKVAGARERLRPAAPPMPQPILAVREYAHRVSPSLDANRTDFAETLYWNAGITTSPSGEAKVTFELGDAVTSFCVRADAVTLNGALGMGETTLEAQRPFYVEPKLPLEVSAGDSIDAVVMVMNGTLDRADVDVAVSVTGALSAISEGTSLEIAPEGRARVLVPIGVGSGRGTATVELQAHAGTHRDRVTRTVEVVPAGFPLTIDAGGRLEAGSAVTHLVALPDALEPGSVTTEVVFYPSPLASLTQALEALLSEPCGCFEQASSSTYPNVLVLQYLTSHPGADPSVLQRAFELTERGYQRLVGYESKASGYEWFGGEPAHEALTAYGVMEFTDMATVYPVDGEMLSRTRAWLLSRRDGRGGFLKNPRALDAFGAAPADITDAYITWALGQAGLSGLEVEVARVRATALESDDAYYLALAASVLLVANDDASGAVLEKLAAKQQADGAVRGAATSITRSLGDSLTVETTALAILAWLTAHGRAEPERGAGGPAPVDLAGKAMEWLLARCQGGRFGATQATVLALKAIVAYDAARSRPKPGGRIVISVDGEPRGEVSFPSGLEEPIGLPSFASALAQGERRVELRMEEGGAMPYSLRVRCATSLPANASACKVALSTALGRDVIAEGEIVDLRIDLGNTTAEALPMVVAIVGLPGGLEARADSLKELVGEGKVDFWETRGREVVLYWRGMAPSARCELTLSLIGAVPGTYAGPASRAYLYYQDEDKSWAPSLHATIS